MSNDETFLAKTTSVEIREEIQSVIQQVLTRFEEAWKRVGEIGPPDLVAFLPEEFTYRRSLLIELLKVDLEIRWRRYSLPKRLREYCSELSDLTLETLPAEIVFQEYCYRKFVDDTLVLDEYLRDFPKQAAQLRRLSQQSPNAQAPSSGETAKIESIDEIQAGQILDDFHLVMPLGQGAFAKVFLARQISMQRFVAVKISLDEGTEPQTLAQLDHNYIVRVHDQRSLETPPCRLLYMQYLPGGTLEAVIKRVAITPVEHRNGQLFLDVLDETLQAKGEIPPTDSSLRRELSRKSWPEVVAWIGIRVAEALAYAGERGVLHRDLKPANILLSAEGVPKLADFNISFSSEVTGTDAAAEFGGSLAYMSPEQLQACIPHSAIRPEDLDGRSDLFSLGVLLWELLTGNRPFDDSAAVHMSQETVEGMIARRWAGLPRSIENTDAVGPQESLVRILSRCLEPDLQQRWTHASEVSTQLEICLEPRASELIDPPQRSWRLFSRRYVIAIVLSLNLIPNGISAIFNYFYNQYEIFEELAAGKSLELILAAVNGIAFPIGIGLVVTLAWKLRQALQEPHKHPPITALRESALQLGHRCAMICLTLWVIAGIAYPLAFIMIGISVTLSEYAHIFGSLVLFGLIATVYPFFGVTWYAVQSLYPGMLQLRCDSSDDRQYLRKLKRLLRGYLVAAASIPMLSVAAITFVSADLLWLAQLLCFGGLLAFGAAFWFYRSIEDDLNIFIHIHD